MNNFKHLIYHFISYSLIILIIFSIVFIFDYRQNDLGSYENDYNYKLDVEIPNEAIQLNRDIFNNFKLYNNNQFENESVYKFLSDSTLLTRIIGKSNNSYIGVLSNNYEKGTLLGCYVIWSCLNSSNLKTLKISLLKENQSIIIFQEKTTFKLLNNKFSESYISLNNITITNETIIIETFIENNIGTIQIYEIYLLIISSENLYPYVYYERFNLIFILNYTFYQNYKQIIKIYFYILTTIFYVLFYFYQNKKIKNFYLK